MTPEHDNSNASWSDSNTVSWDADSVLMDVDDPLTPPSQDDPSPIPTSGNEEDDDSKWVKPPLFSKDSLWPLLRQLSPVLVPLPFALLIFLFAFLARLGSSSSSSQHIPLVLLAILLLALVVVQGTFLYYAGSNDSLWTLYTIAGYAIFLLVGAFALFGAGAAVFLFIILLIIGIIMGGRAIRQVPEGYVALVISFGRYARTLYPGLNFILPWERIEGRPSTMETTWTTRVQENISRDQDVEIVATLTYQLMPEDAHIAVLNMQDWQDTMKQHFIGTIKSVLKELSPSDFLAWSHHVQNRGAAAETFVDPTAMTRWDRLNAILRRRLQDQLAMRGILVNLVHVQDITVVPRLAPVSSPPPGMQAPVQAARPQQANAAIDTGMARSSAAAPMPRYAQPPAAAAPQARVLPLPTPDMFEAMIQMYNSVRDGQITDTSTILDLADRFEAIANTPEVSQNFNYDSARAASNLYQRARVLKAAEARQANKADQSEQTTQIKRPARRPYNDNLAAGG